MSGRITKKHGIIIEAGESWSILKDPVGRIDISPDRHGYRARILCADYRFDTETAATQKIDTPAQQLIWMPVEIYTHQNITGRSIKETRYVPSSFAETWLTQKIGYRFQRWDVRSHCKRNERTLYFRFKKDAIAFAKMVETTLNGIAFTD